MAAVRENPRLSSFFKVLSLSLDKSGDAYVSTLEARDYPFVATQVGGWGGSSTNLVLRVEVATQVGLCAIAACRLVPPPCCACVPPLQWHPEKNAFEWTTSLHIPHSPDAVRHSRTTRHVPCVRAGPVPSVGWVWEHDVWARSSLRNSDGVSHARSCQSAPRCGATRAQVRMSQEVANFFINEARANAHKSASEVRLWWGGWGVGAVCTLHFVFARQGVHLAAVLPGCCRCARLLASPTLCTYAAAPLPPQNEEDDMLIYNWKPEYTGKP